MVRRAAAAGLMLLGAGTLSAQDLVPRAYLITPVGSNAVTLSYGYNDGELLFEGTVPIENATGKLSVPLVAYFRSLDFFGRSANLTAGVPYGVGTFEGDVVGEPRSIRRSGMFDSVIRFSVNLYGGPAMSLPEMRQWRRKHLLGASLKVVAPTGQYDPAKLVNLGANRWTFKPEVAYSRFFGHVELDAYASVVLFTKNPDFYPGTRDQSQKPIGAFEAHLSYDVRPRLWVSLDANFWYGGRSSVDGVENAATLQKNSRIGLTASFPVTRHQSVKVGYARGAYIRFGGDYDIYLGGLAVLLARPDELTAS